MSWITKELKYKVGDILYVHTRAMGSDSQYDYMTVTKIEKRQTWLRSSEKFVWQFQRCGRIARLYADNGASLSCLVFKDKKEFHTFKKNSETHEKLVEFVNSLDPMDDIELISTILKENENV